LLSQTSPLLTLFTCPAFPLILRSMFEGSELGRSFTQTTNYNRLNSLFTTLIFSHVNRSLIATIRSHISSININGKV
jgi:hypothetical protein